MSALRRSSETHKVHAHVDVRLLQQHLSKEDGLLFTGIVHPRLDQFGLSVVEADLHNVVADVGGIGVCHRSLAKKKPRTAHAVSSRGGCHPGGGGRRVAKKTLALLLLLADCQMPPAKPETETSLREQGLLCKEVEGRRECH